MCYPTCFVLFQHSSPQPYSIRVAAAAAAGVACYWLVSGRPSEQPSGSPGGPASLAADAEVDFVGADVEVADVGVGAGADCGGLGVGAAEIRL